MPQLSPGSLRERRVWWILEKDLQDLQDLLRRVANDLQPSVEALVRKAAADAVLHSDRIIAERTNDLDKDLPDRAESAKSILQERQRRLEQVKKDRADEFVKAERRAREKYDAKQKWEVRLADRTRVVEDSLDTLISRHQPQLNNTLVLGFKTEFACGGIEATVELESDGDLSLRTFPETVRESHEMFFRLTRWIDQRRSRWFEQWYEGFGGVLIFVATFWGVLILPAARLTDAQVRTDAFALLQQGVNAGNEHRAIELILTLLSGYGNRVIAPVWPPLWHWCLIGFLFGAGVYPAFSPRALVGLGRTESRIKMWRLVRRFFLIVVPGFLLSYIVDRVKHRLGP